MMLTGIDGASRGTTTITKDGGEGLFSPHSPISFFFFPPFFPFVDQLCVLETLDCESARDRVWQRDERKRNILCRPEMMQLERDGFKEFLCVIVSLVVMMTDKR